MKTLHIQARRFFSRTYGNTYHSSAIYVDGERVANVQFTYGYGEHFLDTAAEKLEEVGLLWRERYPAGHKEWLRNTCERLGIKLTYEVEDTTKKRVVELGRGGY